jgi:pimeloyl-ACP methyl ester carboxylesterase
MQVIAMDGESRPQLPSPSVGETPVWHKPLAPSLNPKRTQATLGCDKEGYFFVGGQWAADGDKKYMVGQMFVQYELPVKETHPYPIVMVHGTAQTGSNFLGTPDGRPGWASYFRDHGYRVYVVDQVGRARSGQSPEAYGPYMRLSARDMESIYTGQETFNLFPQAHLHTQWPGGPGRRGKCEF